MNILFTRFPLESRFGGAEVQTLSLMKGLGDRGHDVEFLGSCPVLRKQLTIYNLQLTSLDIGPPPVTKWSVISFLWRKHSMKKRLISRLATCHLPLATVVMLSLSEKLLLTNWCVEQGIKVIWIEHDRVGRWLKWNPWLPKLRRLSKLATTVVVSDLSRDIYLKMGWAPENIIAIPNGINTDQFKQRQAASGKRQAGFFRIGCISRLTYDKGVDLLIDAVKDLPNVTLEIVGTGPETANLEKLIHQYTNTPITLITSVPNTANFYNQIDCLALPSRSHDPFGLVVAEAMAAGVPTICTEACGISRHFDPEDSIVVPADNANALRDAIIEIQKEDVWRKLSKKGPVVAREKFSVDRMVDKYEEIIKQTKK